MSFVFAGALAALLLVAVPIAAHLLRVRRAQQQAFPPARLVPPSPPTARKRRKLEDRPLFALRVFAIIALALLGATPLLRCSRLAVGRNAGASVGLVIVVDDSMSMRASADGRGTRFDVARKGAADLVAGAREGDSVALVLAGSPPRVALAATTDLSAAADAVDALRVSDRATALDDALSIANAMAKELPQQDRRAVLLSDLCDGNPQGQPLAGVPDVPLWAPRQGLDVPARDCAVIYADRLGKSITARVACSERDASKGRTLQLRAEQQVVMEVPLEPLIREEPGVVDIPMELPPGGREPEIALIAGGSDAVPQNDQAPVARPLDELAVGVVSDRARSAVVTGGPPPVEQALLALATGARVLPLPTVPDVADDLSELRVAILDDPAGLTPEARTAFTAWLKRGGVALVALGPSAASAPLGASFEPFFRGVPRWEERAPSGIDLATGGVLGPTAQDLKDVRPRGRAMLDVEPGAGTQVLIRWSDGAPWLVRHSVGRGVAFSLALPMDAEQSDLVVRPAFLALLSLVLDEARAQGGAGRITVGSSWTFQHVKELEVRHAQGPIEVETLNGDKKVTTELAGRYDLRIDGVVESRLASIPEREVDYRPRRVDDSTTGEQLGATTTSVDISVYLAFVLLALLAAEMTLRVVTAARERAQASS